MASDAPTHVITITRVELNGNPLTLRQIGALVELYEAVKYRMENGYLVSDDLRSIIQRVDEGG